MTDSERPADERDTPPDDADRSTAELLERALAAHANEAPRPVDLAQRARSTRRVRLVRRGGTALVLVAAVSIGAPLIITNLGNSPGSSGTDATDETRVASKPDGFRWESWGNGEIQVPLDWGYGTTAWPSCLPVDRPYVGRPGAVPAIGCMDETPPADGRVPYVWLGYTGSDFDAGDGWKLESRTVGDQAFFVFSDDAALRTRILDSARLVESGKLDKNGCDPYSPFNSPDTDVDQLDARPTTGALPPSAAITGGSICAYSQPDTTAPVRTVVPRLIASARLDTETAAGLADAIGAAPSIGDVHCAYEAYAPQVAVIHLALSGSIRDVYLRYGGCLLNGTDDGVSVRTLTPGLADALRGIPGPAGSDIASSIDASLGSAPIDGEPTASSAP